MTLWDGLTTGNDTRILVLGATNRPNDIDSAILRRMPKRFSIKLPDAGQRRNILTLMLKDLNVDPKFNMEDLVRRTDGLSGSDLKECCRNAAMVPVREYMRTKVGVDGGIDFSQVKDNVRFFISFFRCRGSSLIMLRFATYRNSTSDPCGWKTSS